MGAVDSYCEKLRQGAESRVIKAAKEEIKARRDHEKHMKELGRGGPFDHYVLEDIRTLRKSKRYKLLLEEEGFLERVEHLEKEREGAILAAKAAGDRAVAKALAHLPPEVKMLDRQERERALFLERHGLVEEDIGSAPAGARLGFEELVKKQHDELERIKPVSAASST